MVYIALNMVRCGVVAHPRDWSWCGYHELVGVRQRYRILDVARVLALLGGVTVEDFRGHYEEMINERIAKDQMRRDPRWTEAVAVGSEGFVRGLATRIKGRQKLEIGPGAGEGEWVLREAVLPYTADGPTETGSKP
ncbi:MAG: hypothetical protein KDM81_06440 [Verrucomicrobiae bacterium]|nr:hypothetical protein [Verrucomicrobiae bacterium]